MDPAFWDGILGNLQVLAVVAEQPDLSCQEWFEVATLQEVLAKSIAWITPIFEYLRRALNKDAKIMVDANDEEKTVEVIKEAMPGRCHFQQLPMADFIIGRGKFASASAFWGGYWGQVEDDPITARDCIDDEDYDLCYSDWGLPAAHETRPYRRLDALFYNLFVGRWIDPVWQALLTMLGSCSTTAEANGMLDIETEYYY